MQTKVKLTKRVVSLATALVTGLSAVGVTGIPGGVFGTLSASAEDGHNYVNGFCTDEGCASPYEPATEENGTYQIANAGNLYWFAEQVNDGNANLNAALTTDIVVNEGNVAGCNGTKDESWRDWEPIGNDSSEYSGTFDGKGHTISGLYFFSDSYEANIVGVVGYLKTGTIQNIGLENSYFYSSNGSYIAGICGYNEGGTIDNCYNAGNINGQQGVGGICGRNNGVFKFASFSFIAGVIKNCYNTGNISGSHSKIGGVCGLNNFTLENCYNTGNVTGGTSASFVGGIVGNNYIDNRNSGYTFRNCYNTGTVTGKSSFGAVYGSDTYKDAQNCYYLSETEVPESDGISGKTADQFASGEVTYLLNGSKPGDANIFRQNLDNGEPTDATPVLDSAHDVVYEGKLCTSGTGYTNDEDSTSEIHAWDEDGFCKNDDTHYQPAVKNAENVYEISNAGQLYWFASEVNGGNCVNAILTKDIVVNKGDVAGCEGTKTKGWREWTPISYYFDQKMGDFDGKGHTISGLYCNDKNNDAGLFARAGHIRISNVGVINSYIKGKENAGGITAKNDSYGSIRNCYSICTVSGYDDNAKVGGICGSSSYEIENCYSVSNGGVCSANSATIGNCYYLSDSETDDIDGTTAKTAEQFKNGEVCYLLNGGKSDETVAFYQTIGEDDYPVLDSTHKVVYADTDCDGSALNYTNGSDVSQSDHDWDDNGFCKNYPTHYQKPEEVNGVYQIANAGQLYWFAAYVNTYDYDNATYPNVAANAVLTADITVNEGDVAGCDGTKAEGWRVWTPIAPNTATYAGKFDGQGHTISGLYFNNEEEDYVGIFGQLRDGGEIQNVGLKNSYFRGRNYIGGVVGENNGTVENCYNTGNVVGNKWVGGVCGYNDGTNNNCYNTGKVTGTSYVGDVCGQNDKGTLTNCYYLADSETNNNDGTFGKTAEQFASGEVAYLLNGSESTDVAFCQNLDNGEPTDATPVLDSTHGTVYQFTNCNHADTYTNNKDAKSGDHSWDDNGFCRYNDSHYAEPEQVNGVYQIENAGQLYWFAAFVNTEENGTYPNTSANAVLTKDIVVNENVLNEDGTLNTSGTFREWIPIGDYISRYAGKFNGQNHTVSGLYYDDSGYAGLFSMMNDGTILNVGVVDSYLKSSSVSGAICAWNNGTIENCYNSGRIYGKEDCGGISGFNGGIIKNCYNTGTLEGGMDGTLNGVGGICGYNDETIENCHSVGKIENAVGYIGGVCALNFKVIRNCYFNSDIYTGNRIGYESSVGTIENVEGKTTAEFASGEVCYLLNGDQTKIAFYQTIGKDDYPVLDSTRGQVYEKMKDCSGALDGYTNDKDESFVDHDWDENGFCKTYPDSHYQPATQNEDGTYEIENAGELYWFAAQVNDGKITDADAVLTADITVNEGNVAGCDGTKTEGWRDWTPIIGIHYMGTFDGQGHVIRGLYFNDTRVGNIGLFSNLNKEGKIQNVGLENSYFRGVAYVGGICAYSNGTIENCYNAGTITAEYDYVGGLVANNFGSIVNCYNTGNITADKDTGGGVAAWNNSGGTIKNCYNSGTLTGGSMNGVVQINDKDGTVENCYYLSDSETDDFDGTTFKTADQFASGEVCYLLNGDQSAIAFYQDLSSEKYPTLNADSEQVCRLEMTYDESFGEDAATVTTYHNTGAKITLEKSPDNAYTYHYYVGETEITESPYTLTADTEIIVKKVPVEIQLSEGISDTIELTYHKKMDALDLNDFVTNLDVLESVDFQVDAASALPEGLTLTAEGVLSGTPEKATDKVKTTLILTAKNGASKKAELTFHIAKADPTVEVTVDGDKHTEGDPVDELGLILSDNSTKGTVKIVGEIKRLAAGKNTLTWEFTPADSDNYNVVTGTVIVNAQATTTTTVTTTKATTVITSGTTSTTKASTATSRTTSATKASTATSGATSTTKASATTNGTTSTTKASTATSGTTSATKASVTTNGTTSTTKASVTISGTTSTTKASVTTSGTTSTTKATTVTTSGTTSTTKASTSTSGMTSTTKASATTSGTTSTTKASTTTNGTTSTTKVSTTINGTTSTTKASVTTSGTTSTTKASTTASGTTSMTKVSTTTSGTTFTTKASTTTSGTTFTTKASTTTSGTTSTTTTATTSATATTTTTVTTSITTASATTTSTTTTSATSSTTNTTTTTTTASTTSSETTTTTSTTSGTTETSETTSTTETGTSTSTSSSDTPEGQISVTISTESVYCTAEDSTPFDLASFMSVSLVNAAGETVDVTADVTLEYDSPAALFAARNTAYVAENLKATYTAENGEVYEITGPMVYIGKKGDANLDGKVDSTDIYELMRYIAYVGAGFSDTKLLETSPDAADENLSVLAYFLADADTESTEGKNTAEKRLDPQDMFYVMYYVANRGAGVPVTWSDIIR
ncbi:GLUG motif-containing protein [Ruminococcus sp.]|uniref:GLUG motif-containing protein n=1 Tax=Ruminococcus sp. TaxID=41978 RepID=UPI003FD7DA65